MLIVEETAKNIVNRSDTLVYPSLNRFYPPYMMVFIFVYRLLRLTES